MDPLGGLNPAQGQAQQRAQQQGWTQQQIEYAREIAAQLNKSASENGPIYSPWAGAARMADALFGGLTANRAMQMQRQNQAAMTPFSDTSTGATPSAAMPSASAPSAVPSSSSDLSYGSGIVPMDAAKAAIAGNESNGGDYSLKNPTTGALGKYQVMPQYLHDHLAAAGMPDMTPEQFLASPQAQETQFEREFGALQQKHGSFNKAAIEWFGGPKGLQHVLSGNDISDGSHTGSWYLSNANATLGKLAQAQGGASVTQGSPQGAPNAPGATQAPPTPQTAQQPPVSQGAAQGAQSPQFGAESGTFIDPKIIQAMRPYSIAQIQQGRMTGQISPEQAAQYLQSLTAPIPYGGGSIRINPQDPSQQTYIPDMKTQVLKDYGGKENLQTYYVDARGQLHTVGGAGQTQGTGGLYDYESTKAAAAKEAERENKIYSGFSGDAEVHNQMKPFIQIGLSVLDNANLWTGPLNEQAQKVKQALVNAGMAPADAAAPMEVFKKTMAQAMVTKMNLMKTQGSETGEAASRIFLPMVQQMQDSSPSADNSVAGNRYLLNTMNHERDRANARADLADKWKTGHGGSMLGFDQELRNQERNNPIFQAQPDELFVGGHAPGAQPPMPNEGDTRKLSSGATAVFKNGQWQKQ